MSFEIRKIVSYVEETFIEGGKACLLYTSDAADE